MEDFWGFVVAMYKMMVKQASGMQEYYNALRNRMVDAGIIEAPDCAS